MTTTPAAFREALRLAFDPMFIADWDSAELLYANDAAERLFGYPTEGMVGMRGRDLHPASERPALASIAESLRQSGRAQLPQVRVITRDGRTSWGDLEVRLFEDAGRKCMVARIRDITEQVRREARLVESVEAQRKAQGRALESETRFRALVEAVSDAILVSDSETARLVDWNEAASIMLGYHPEELAGLVGRQLFSEPFGQAFDGLSARLLSSGVAAHPRAPIRRRDGSTFWGDIRINSFELFGRRLHVSVIRDVSAQVEHEQALEQSMEALRSAQAQIIQTSKMAAMGALSAGIAHELNQPLTIISGFVARVLRHPDEPVSRFGRDLGIITGAAARMATIVDNIRTFGRQDARHRPTPTLPQQPVTAALMLVKTQLRECGIDVSLSVGPTVRPTLLDGPRMQQVFLNLLTNARDAIAARAGASGGHISIGIAQGDSSLRYQVEDDGAGVSPEIERRLFDPFFTTKEPGQGTGLGLAIAHGILTDHGGTIRFRPAESGGACFHICVPTRAVEAEAACP